MPGFSGTMNGYGDSHDSTANIRCLLAKMEGKNAVSHRARAVARLAEFLLA